MDSAWGTAIVSAAAGLIGASLGGWVTWHATKSAAASSADATLQATKVAAEAALRLSRIERIDPLVEQLAEEAGRLFDVIEGQEEPIQDLAFVQALAPTWNRVRGVSPQFSRLLQELHSYFQELIREVDWQDGPSHEWRERAVVPLLTTIDMCHEWHNDADAYEGRPIQMKDLVEEALRVRGWGPGS